MNSVGNGVDNIGDINIVSGQSKTVFKLILRMQDVVFLLILTCIWSMMESTPMMLNTQYSIIMVMWCAGFMRYGVSEFYRVLLSAVFVDRVFLLSPTLQI